MSDSVPEIHSCETYRVLKRMFSVLSLDWLSHMGAWGTNCINSTECLAARCVVSPCSSHTHLFLEPLFQTRAFSNLFLAPLLEWRMIFILSMWLLGNKLRLHHNWSSSHQHVQPLAKLALRCRCEACHRSVIANTYWIDVPEQIKFSSTPFISCNHFCSQQVKKDISKWMIQLYKSFDILFWIVCSGKVDVALKTHTSEVPFFEII